MKLFNKTKDKNIVASDAQLRVSDKWEALKQNISLRLQRKSELLSTQTKKNCLIFFCLLFGGSSIAVIIHSASTKNQAVSITHISKPTHAVPDEKNYLEADSAINKAEYNRIEQVKNYLFHLKNDRMLSNEFDSITKARPHLIDSINLFEKIYLQQK